MKRNFLNSNILFCLFLLISGCFSDDISYVKGYKDAYTNNKTIGGIIEDYNFKKSIEWKSFSEDNKKYVEAIIEIDLEKCFTSLFENLWIHQVNDKEVSYFLERINHKKIKNDVANFYKNDSHGGKYYLSLQKSKSFIKNNLSYVFDYNLKVHIIFFIDADKNVKTVRNYYEIIGKNGRNKKLEFDGIKMNESEYYIIHFIGNNILNIARALVAYTIYDVAKEDILYVENEIRERKIIEERKNIELENSCIQKVKNYYLTFNKTKTFGDAMENCEFITDKVYIVDNDKSNDSKFALNASNIISYNSKFLSSDGVWKTLDKENYLRVAFIAEVDLGKLNKIFLNSIMDNGKINIDVINNYNEQVYRASPVRMNGKMVSFSKWLSEYSYTESYHSYFNGLEHFTKNSMTDENKFLKSVKAYVYFNFIVSKYEDNVALQYFSISTKQNFYNGGEINEYNSLLKEIMNNNNMLWRGLFGIEYFNNMGHSRSFDYNTKKINRELTIENINNIYENKPIYYGLLMCANIFILYNENYDFFQKTVEEKRRMIF